MIGKIYKILTPFFNVKTGKKEFKVRPALIISDIRNNDYAVLLVSTISRPEISDLKASYPNLFEDIILHLSQYNEEIFNNAVE